ncbi:MAG: hypothetical protein AAF900_02570 [Bacteroidota bacterium]
MVNLLLALFVPILSTQTIPNTADVPTQQPLVVQAGPQTMGAIPMQEIALGKEKAYTIAVNDYFYEPNGLQLTISAIEVISYEAIAKGVCLESYTWLNFYAPYSTLFIKPVKEEDKGYYHLRVVASNSIGQNASQFMTVCVVDVEKPSVIIPLPCDELSFFEIIGVAESILASVGMMVGCLCHIYKRTQVAAKEEFFYSGIERKINMEDYDPKEKIESFITKTIKEDKGYQTKICCCPITHKLSEKKLKAIEERVICKLSIILEDRKNGKIDDTRKNYLKEALSVPMGIIDSINDKTDEQMKRWSSPMSKKKRNFLDPINFSTPNAKQSTSGLSKMIAKAREMDEDKFQDNNKNENNTSDQSPNMSTDNSTSQQLHPAGEHAEKDNLYYGTVLNSGPEIFNLDTLKA